jgi:hypothetical protein
MKRFMWYSLTTWLESVVRAMCHVDTSTEFGFQKIDVTGLALR